MPSAREPEPWKDAVQIEHLPGGRWRLVVDREKMRLLDEHLLAPPSPARLRAIERVENLPRNAPGTAHDHVYMHYAAALQMLAMKRAGRIVLPGATDPGPVHPAKVMEPREPHPEIPQDPPILRDPLPLLAPRWLAEGARFVVMGVWGANLYARYGGEELHTQDQDLFLPPEPENLLTLWRVAEDLGFELWCGGEPLDRPRDPWLARKVVQRRALTRVLRDGHLPVDLNLVMGDAEFEAVDAQKRMLKVSGQDIPVARLMHIVEAKRKAGREKDTKFLAMHFDALRDLEDEVQRRWDEEPDR
ncbi:MAG: hypothetical protein EPO68_08820 [Planctomycetota bacterium]|nr:MAG: hypothetical protein EPO68_08820 [Planctomycetota bacterium]